MYVVKRDTNYNDIKLRVQHPQVARAFEGILLRDKAVANRLKYLYYSDFKTASRDRKSISLARILREIEDAGLKIEINVHGTINEISTRETK